MNHPNKANSELKMKRGGIIVTWAWCLACCAIMLYCLKDAEKEAARLMLFYFQPVIPPLLMLWLWARNIRCFETHQMDFDQCFSARDRKFLIPGSEISKLALAASAIISTWACVFSLTVSMRLYVFTEFVPYLLYCSLVILVALPLNVLNRGSRLFFFQTSARVLFPFQAVSWADFLMADMFTSLAKSTSDLTQAMCAMSTGPSLQRLTSPRFKGVPPLCSPLSLLSQAAVCLPYAIRFIQCIIVYLTTGNTNQLINALKYCSAFPALTLTIIEHDKHVHGQPFGSFWMWIGFSLFNSAFSYYWDIEQDWDMPWIAAAVYTPPPPPGRLGMPHQHPHHHRLTRLRMLLPSLRASVVFSTYWYGWAVISNLVLRLSWTHRLLGNLEAMSAVALVVAMGEVFRRYQWAFVRVETELRKRRQLMMAPPVVVASQEEPGLLHEVKQHRAASPSCLK